MARWLGSDAQCNHGADVVGTRLVAPWRVEKLVGTGTGHLWPTDEAGHNIGKQRDLPIVVPLWTATSASRFGQDPFRHVTYREPSFYSEMCILRV
jgi:hypothetical protein